MQLYSIVSMQRLCNAHVLVAQDQCLPSHVNRGWQVELVRLRRHGGSGGGRGH